MCHLAFPFGFQGRDVHDDAAAGIGRLAEADHQHVAGDAEILDRVGQREGVGRDDADVGLAIDEAVLVEGFRVDDGALSTLVKILNSSAHAGVVAVGGQAVGDHALAVLRFRRTGSIMP